MFNLISGLGSACSVLVAGTLGWAAISKIRRPWTVDEALAGLGLQRIRTIPFVSRIVPWGELVLALVVLFLPSEWGRLSGWFSVLVGLVLLGIVWRAYAQVAEASCSCFGAKSAVTRRTVARNAMFAVMAIVGAALRPESLWSPDQIVPTAAGALVLAVAAAFGWAMAPASEGRTGRTLMVPRVLRASELVFRGASGGEVVLSDHLAGRAGVVVFLGEGEENEQAFVAATSSSNALGPDATVVTVKSGLISGASSAATFEDAGSMGSRLAGVAYFPTALLVGRDGVVATEPNDGAGIDAVESLLEAVADALNVGNPNPES